MSNPSNSILGTVGGALYGQVGQNGAPVIDETEVNQQLGNATANQGQEQGVLNTLGAAAAGQGPSAAQALLEQQTKQAQAQNDALAASGSGGDQALSRRTAIMANTGAAQNLGGQAAVARNAEQLGAMGQEAGLTTAMTGQNIQEAGLEGNIGAENAQNAVTTQGQNLQGQEANQSTNAGFLSNFGGAASGVLSLFADADIGKAGADFKEPGGDAEWTIREEKDFLLLVNRRNGKMFKMGMQPLSPEEHRQAMAPHGAGPINAPAGQGRQAKQMADGDLGKGGGAGGGGQQEQFAAIVHRAHPHLYKAAFADGDMGGDQALGEQIARAGYGGGGRDRGDDASAYPVPGFVSAPGMHRGPDPEDQPGSTLEWDQADRLAKAAGSPPTPEADPGYARGWDDTIHAHGGSAPGDPEKKGPNASAVLAAAFQGFADPKSAGKFAQDYRARTQPRAQVAPSQAPQTYADGDLSAGIDKAWAAAEAKANAAKAAREAPDLLRELHAEKMGILRDLDRHTPDVEQQPLLKPRAGRTPSIDRLYASPDDQRGLDVLSREGEYPTARGRGLPTESPADYQRREQSYSLASPSGDTITAPRYQDADLGDQDPFVAEPSRAVSRDRKRLLYGKGSAEVDADDARASFDQDVAKLGSDLGRVGSRYNPADADEEDPLVRGLDDAMRAGEKAARRPGTPGNPVDLDADDWTPSDRKPARPALASLFTSRSKAGPTDWATAVREGQRGEARERGLSEQIRKNKKAPLDLVPYEARELVASYGDDATREAERRTRSRMAVKDLIKMWERERSAKERGTRYADADLTPAQKQDPKDIPFTSKPGETMDPKSKLRTVSNPPKRTGGGDIYPDADLKKGSALSRLKMPKARRVA